MRQTIGTAVWALAVIATAYWTFVYTLIEVTTRGLTATSPVTVVVLVAGLLAVLGTGLRPYRRLAWLLGGVGVVLSPWFLPISLPIAIPLLGAALLWGVRSPPRERTD